MNNSRFRALLRCAFITSPARTAALRIAAFSALAAAVCYAAAPALAEQARPSAGSASARPASALRATGPAPRAFFGLGPASKTKIDGRSYFIWSATPGSYLTDHVALVDFGTTPLTLRVFATNAVSTAHGGTGFTKQVIKKEGPAAWVTIHLPHHASSVRLAPRSKLIVPITVVIPKNAPPGDHEGAVIAALTSVVKTKKNVKVHLVQQVAVRIIARVSGKLRPRLSITGLRVHYSAPLNPFGTAPATLTFTVKNTGNELLGGKVSASVHGLFASTEDRRNAVMVPVMLPGGSDQASITIPGVYPEFLMTDRVTITPAIATGQYDPGLTNFAAQSTFLAIPWIPVAIVILLAAAGFWLWWRRRRPVRPDAGDDSGGRQSDPVKVEA